MLTTFIAYALPFSFTLLVTCVLASVVSGIMLWVFRLRRTNEIMRHPYLAQHPWARYPFSIRAAILLDYFLRIVFPKSSFWVAGQANRLLAHVDPGDVPMGIKWPIVGFWGGCFVGIATMLALWTMILLTMGA
ncbi:MAG TPA: hypothetical protein VL001_06785 [Candidimonas sp.]|nr:hypothetical protein [Candidimonas sp.]